MTPSKRAARGPLWLIPAAAVALLGGLASTAQSQAPAAGAAPAAVDGKAEYMTNCAACHSADLSGGAGPTLRGSGFMRNWSDAHGAEALYSLIHDTMPQGAPSSLSDAQYHAITDYILAQNGVTPGGAPAAAASNEPKFTPTEQRPTPPGGAVPRRFEPLPSPNPKTVSATSPSDEELRHVAPEDWLVYNRDLYGDRHSPLSEINTGNVGKLQVKCIFQVGELGSFQNSPVIYKGVLYVNGRTKTVALDAKTCKRKWMHEYVLQNPDSAIADARSVAVYKGKVIRGTADGHLIALNAENGELLWDTAVHDSRVGYAISMGVVAYDGVVFVGESGADRGIQGRAFGFDAETGKALWAFDVIPTGKQTGANTWVAGQELGGGSSWSTVAIDPAKHEVLFPFGNPGPDFNGRPRQGDNLFTESVVALGVKTGKLSWWVQQIPHDTHDWDTAAAPALYDQDGKHYMAVVQKNGYVYIYDRDTHKLIAKPAWSPHFENVDVPLRMDTALLICPGAHGAWNGAAYSPSAKAIFVGSEYKCTAIQQQEPKYTLGQMYYAGKSTPPPQQILGFIQSFDAVTGKKLWSYQTNTAINAAVTTTDGGLVLGADTEGNFLALDQKTGKVLYEFFMGGPAAGGISVYGVDGKEYIAVSSGNSSRTAAASYGSATITVFGL